LKISLLLTLFLCGNTFCEPTVNLAIGEWPPYVSEQDDDGKILENVVTEAFAIEGFRTNFEYFPWKRSYENTKLGYADGTFPWNKTPTREREFLTHSIPLIKDEGVFFHLVDTDFEWQELADLKAYRVGVVIGFKQLDEYKRLGITPELIEDEEAAFKMLLTGRIEVYQTSKTVGLSTIKQLFTPELAENITFHPKASEVNEYFVLFSKSSINSENLAISLDAGLQKLKESGRYAELVDVLKTAD